MIDTVFVVFSGEYDLMEVKSKQLEGTLPVFRIEGVFNSKQKCKDWIEWHSAGKQTSLLSYIEIPVDLEVGQTEQNLDVYTVHMNADFKIKEIFLGEDLAIPEGKQYSYKTLGNGDIWGSLWARDFIDACKVAYIGAQETLAKKKNDLP